MTGHDDFDRTLVGWFESEALSPAPAGGLDRILDATRRRRPLPAWLAGPGSHWVGEAPDAGSNPRVRLLPPLGVGWSTALILLLAIAALVGGAIVVGARLLEPSPLPTGHLGHLAYDLDGDIFVADWDGSNPVRIADSPSGVPNVCGDFRRAEGSIWSPDGRYLTYRSGLAGCSGAVYISDPAGHVVASFPGSGRLVSWSPDSSRVATWVELSETVGIYGIDGIRQALLSLPPGYEMNSDFDPEWSPDGTSIVIEQTWELPVDAGTPRRIAVDNPLSRRRIAYSRDGRQVAYTGEDDSLYVAAADGTRSRVLTTARGMDFAPLWSPTGQRIAFAVATDPSGARDTYDLRVVDVASGKVTRLATVRGVWSSPLIRFSPEGDRILFWRADADVPSLWSVNADGSNARLLVTGTEWGDWQWQPDGS